MQLTVPQLQAIKAWVIANNSSLFDQSAVDALNATAAPDYFIFRERVDLALVMANGYDWTVVDNESVGQARIWDRMLSLNRTLLDAGKGGIEPWKTTILKGVGEAYKGGSPATVPPHRRNILRTHFVRLSRTWERLFVAAAEDWNVGTNGDKTGVRGLITNPDVMPLDAAGEYLAGLITLDIVVASEGS